MWFCDAWNAETEMPACEMVRFTFSICSGVTLFASSVVARARQNHVGETILTGELNIRFRERPKDSEPRLPLLGALRLPRQRKLGSSHSDRAHQCAPGHV